MDNQETATSCLACKEPLRPSRRLARDQVQVGRRPEPDPAPTPPPALAAGGLAAAQFLARLQAQSRGDAEPALVPDTVAAAPSTAPAARRVTQVTQRFPVLQQAPPPSGNTPPPTAPPTAAPGPMAPPVSRVQPLRHGDPRIVAWLCCDPFPPVPLGGEALVTIGRAAESSLVLPHPGVSRTHAVVRVAGRELTFEDRSSYGSYVNGNRVLSHILAVSDMLTIGPYEIRVRASDEIDENGAVKEQTRPIETFRSLPSAVAMSGRLEKSSLAEVLQAIEFNAKTGTLEVFTDDGRSGQLVVYEGAPMCAAFGSLAGAEAVIDLVGQRRGCYSFHAKIEAGERTIETTITALLLEAGRRADEVAAIAKPRRAP